jgi:hypothetical protein
MYARLITNDKYYIFRINSIKQKPPLLSGGSDYFFFTQLGYLLPKIVFIPF